MKAYYDNHIEMLPSEIQDLVHADCVKFAEALGVPLEWDNVKRERLSTLLNIDDIGIEIGLRFDRYGIICRYWNENGKLPTLYYDIENDSYITKEDLQTEYIELFENGETETETFADYVTNCTSKNGSLSIA